MDSTRTEKLGGLRQRKRKETADRIVAAAVRLFVAEGFEATSIDRLAKAAGISRRTFFNYFSSKDDILMSLQAGLGDALDQAVRQANPDLRPFDAVAQAFGAVMAQYPPGEMIAIDRLMRTNAAVQATKQASYARHEAKLFAALCARWPHPERQAALGLVAAAAVGALRLSVDRWAQEGGTRPMAKVLDEAFAALRSEI